MITDTEQKRLNAVARANEVYDHLSRIWSLRSHIVTLMNNHEPGKGDNATRRDCETFHARLRDLGLKDEIGIELARDQAVRAKT